MLRKPSGELGTVRRGFFIILILVFNAFTWLYATPIVINSILSGLIVTNTSNFIIWTAYYAAIVGSSIIGSTLSNKIKRLSFLYLWIILGVIVSLLPALINTFTIVHVLIISILFGVSFGLGIPSCLAYFADCTLVENRGRIGGIIFLITNLSAPLFVILFGMSSLVANCIILAVWRGFGLIVFLLKPEEKFGLETKKNTSFILVFHNKSFVLYFIAWLMFCLVDRIEWPILKYVFGDFWYSMLIIEPIVGSFSTLIAGILSDQIGRKRVILYGFITLGIAYAIIGIAPTTVIAWYFYFVISSVSTGILWVTFILILWGDLSQSGAREKYYVIGNAPFFITSIAQLLSAPYVMLISVTSAFSLAAFFLFVAVLPLLYAPETLPEKKIELRRLRKYVEKAKKVKEKHEVKEGV